VRHCLERNRTRIQSLAIQSSSRETAWQCCHAPVQRAETSASSWKCGRAARGRPVAIVSAVGLLGFSREAPAPAASSMAAQPCPSRDRSSGARRISGDLPDRRSRGLPANVSGRRQIFGASGGRSAAADSRKINSTHQGAAMVAGRQLAGVLFTRDACLQGTIRAAPRSAALPPDRRPASAAATTTAGPVDLLPPGGRAHSTA